MSRQETRADHFNDRTGAFLCQQLRSCRSATIFILVLGVMCAIFFVGWLQRGKAARDLKSDSRYLRGRLRRAEFENRGLREVVAPLISQAFTEFPGEETTRALKMVVARLESEDIVRRPIASVLAAVEIFVESDLKIDKKHAAGGGYLAFCRGSDTLLMVSSDSIYAHRDKEGKVRYSGVLQMSATDPGAGKPMNFLGEAEYLKIGFDAAPKNSVVADGKVTVVVNASRRFEFQIPSQKMLENTLFIRGIGNFIESQTESKSQANVSISSNRSTSETPTKEEIKKAVGAYLQYASTAEVRGPLSVGQVEEELLRSTLEWIVNEGLRPDKLQVPFGFMNDRWQSFKAQLRGMDQIYYYISDKDSWAVLCGSAGYALIREGLVIDTFVTSGN